MSLGSADTETPVRQKDKAKLSRFHSGIAEAAKRRRSQLKISQEETARRSGLCRSYLSDIERGARTISLNNFYLLSEALEMPAWQMLQFAEQLCGLASTPEHE